MTSNRYDRQEAMFGAQGQEKLAATSIAVVGAGGVGSLVAMELSLLGIGRMFVIDDDGLEVTNRNRHVSARHDDPEGAPKAALVVRHAISYRTDLRAEAITGSVLSVAGYGALRLADLVIGCLDEDGPRLALTEFCAAFDRPYVDIATEVPPAAPHLYGGRVCVSIGGAGCLACLGLIDLDDARGYFQSAAQRRDHERIYGVAKDELAGSGPSVVCMNGVVASAGCVEVMKLVTGSSPPTRLQRYYGESSKIVVSTDEPLPECWYCRGVHGRGEQAGAERYFNLSGPSEMN